TYAFTSTLLAATLARGIAEQLVVAVDLVHRRADPFGEAGEQPVPSEECRVLALDAGEFLDIRHPGCLVELRIVERHPQLDGIGFRARVALLDSRVRAFRKAEDVYPGTVVETDRVHHQRVPLPPTRGVAVP